MVMETLKYKMLPCIAFLLIMWHLPSSTLSQEEEKPKTFIVHVSKSEKPAIFASHHHWYTSTLASLPPSPHPTKILYTYEHAFNGFAVRLTPTQAATLKNATGILTVLPDRILQLQTTYTAEFLGLSSGSGLWQQSDYGDDIIIGVLDTGIWPESPSFFEAGLSPIPNRWRGICVTSSDFPARSCNRKLIGARFYLTAYEEEYGPIDTATESRSPRDTDGHGTHVASTAAGSAVQGAGFYGLAVGQARGMATKARIAAYKVCWKEGCSEADILAGINQAIVDNVDVLSMSLGGTEIITIQGQNYNVPSDYYEDNIAIGAFGAVRSGKIVSCSAGNDGPESESVINVAPWILTVAASTISRDFRGDAILGDGRVFSGVSLYSGNSLSPTYYRLVYAGNFGDRQCDKNTLSPQVRGTIVLCDAGGDNSEVEKGHVVSLAGGVGMILISDLNSGPGSEAHPHLIPATMVDPTSGNTIRTYITSQASPTATLVFRGTIVGSSIRAPQVAPFSSRGPNYISNYIIKPDVIAPGVNILAAWSGRASPSESDDIDRRRVDYNIISGTSMACPHVSGLAAMIRKIHPSWSPSAIKSALMTTTYNVDNAGSNIRDLETGNAATPFDLGSGHVDPNRALDPGLVYDLGEIDYLGFLCASGYTRNQIAIITNNPTADCSMTWLDNPGDLNYPSFSVFFQSVSAVVTHPRVVKNVGNSLNAVYNVRVIGSPSSVQITVSPTRLVFNAQSTSLEYTVRFASVASQVDGLPKFASIEWSDAAGHVVRSPMAFGWAGGSVSAI